MTVDLKKLKEYQQELEERTSGGKNWINTQKFKDGVDFRVLEPLANMNGLYFLEVPVWWVNGKKALSPRVFDEVDVIAEVIDDAKSQKDPDIDALIKASGPNGPRLQLKLEYWMSVLQFDWKFEGDDIVGIFDDSGNVDVNLIDKYIIDQRPKILAAGTQLLKAINHEATIRGGASMFDRVNGTNLFGKRTGSSRKTVYTADKMDQFPMPEKYYGEGNSPDLLLHCKAGMLTDDYMEMLICWYLYGDEFEEKDDNSYRYPDAVEALKEDTTEAPKSKSRGRGRPKQEADTGQEPEQEQGQDQESPPEQEQEQQQEKQPSGRGSGRSPRAARKDAGTDKQPATGKGRRGNTSGRTPAGQGRGRGRNVMDDLKDPKDD
jgi:hypothetical protein